MKIKWKSTWWGTLLAMCIVPLMLASTAAAYDGQSNNAKGVRIDVLPMQLATGDTVRFEVRMNTHTVPLNQDLKTSAVLRDDQGREYRPVEWEGSPPGGHHRSGTLIFPELGVSVTSVTLTLQNVGGVPARDFSWQVKP